MISIIVPVYNAENYIADTIRMVQQQTYRDWELILVDDCSRDQSTAIIEKCIAESGIRISGSEHNSNHGHTAQVTLTENEGEHSAERTSTENSIRLIRKPANEGAAKARNTGLDAARGRYIAFLDADDLWEKEKLERELAFMEERSAGFAFMSYRFGDENGIPTGKAVRVPQLLTYREALTRTIIFTSTVLFDTRRIPKELLYMPAIGSEDTATWWQILRAGYTAYGMDELLVTYRRPEKSLSSNKGKAIHRMWGLYRNVAGMNPAAAALHMPLWAFHAAMRRIVPDRRQ